MAGSNSQTFSRQQVKVQSTKGLTEFRPKKKKKKKSKYTANTQDLKNTRKRKKVVTFKPVKIK